MLYLSYGQPKSGSTFTARLVIKIIEVRYGVDLKEFRVRTLPERLRYMYQKVHGELVEEFNSIVPPDFVYPIKTHARPDETIVQMVESGEVKACASFRDPRDMAISLLDAGRVERTRDIQRVAFSQIHTIEDTLPLLRHSLRTLKRWLSVEGVLLVPYQMIARRPDLVVRWVIEQLDFGGIDETAILEWLMLNKSTFREYNVAVPTRHRTEMSPEVQEYFSSEFEEDIAMVDELTRKVAYESGMILETSDKTPAGDMTTAPTACQLEHQGLQHMADNLSRDDLTELNHKIVTKRKELKLEKQKFEALRSELAALKAERDELTAKRDAETSVAAAKR